MLSGGGIAVPEGRAADRDGCLRVAERIGWPVALKLAGPGARPQDRRRRARASTSSADQARAAFASARPLAGGRPGRSVLVERMAPPGVELFVAARADAVVPALVVGLGGIWAEALDDVAIVPPARGRRPRRGGDRSLRGAARARRRARPEPADLASVAELAAPRVGDLLLERDPSLLELNPVVGPP